MRRLVRTAPLAAVLFAVALLPASARAQGGINLAWNACASEGGAASRTHDCDVSAGSSELVASFVLDAPIDDLVGLGAIVDIQTTTTSLPDWWQFAFASACRRTAAAASFDFTTAPGVACFDPWQGQAVGGIGGYQTSTSSPPLPNAAPNQARMWIVGAVSQPVALPAGTEFHAFRLRIDHSRSSGTDACAGCGAGACIALSRIELESPNGARRVLTTPLQGSIVTWQCANWHGHVGCEAIPGCPTPARPTSWGQIKGLYR